MSETTTQYVDRPSAATPTMGLGAADSTAGDTENRGAKPARPGKLELTQEELDRIIGERLARQRAQLGDAPSLKQRLEQMEAQAQELQQSATRRTERVNQLEQKLSEAEAQLKSAVQRAARAEIICSAGLAPELAELVPMGDEETVRGFIAERIRPLQEKLQAVQSVGGTNTNPSHAESGQRARLSQLAAQAARGSRKALLEWAALREQSYSAK
jgi:chromosome segregation ATPase